MNVDINQIRTIIAETAATEIMPRFRKLAAGDVEMKAVNDPVTVADKASERELTRRFTAYLPGSVVVGEESVAADKSVLARLTEDAPVWVIDPIDGTRNFVAGKPEFAVMVALLRDRRAVASWIHDPNSGDTIMAEEGAGVWLRGKRLKLAAAQPGGDVVGLVGSRVKKLIADSSLIPQDAAMPKIEIGSCAGFDYPRLFAGDATFAHAKTARAGFLFYRHTNPWDHAPGLFLHKEGGGHSANWAGQPYNMLNMRDGLLLAGDREHWQRLHTIFQPLMRHVTEKDVWKD